MTGALVDIRGASVSRNGRAVLRDVTVQVLPGEFVGVIGPNGAGKTTLLMLINGLVRPSSGSVRTLGVQPAGMCGYRVRRRVGYVSQMEPVDGRLPMIVRETVGLGAAGRRRWLRPPDQDLRRRVDGALRQTDILELAGRPIGQLSGGEYQRTAIARVLVQAPDLFLFDEPTASIDPRAQDEILGIIDRLPLDRGGAALYVTHELDSLPERCTRLVLLKDGCIWRQGPPKEMLAPAILDALYSTARSCRALGTRPRGAAVR